MVEVNAFSVHSNQGIVVENASHNAQVDIQSPIEILNIQDLSLVLVVQRGRRCAEYGRSWTETVMTFRFSQKHQTRKFI